MKPSFMFYGAFGPRWMYTVPFVGTSERVEIFGGFSVTLRVHHCFHGWFCNRNISREHGMVKDFFEVVSADHPAGDDYVFKASRALVAHYEYLNDKHVCDHYCSTDPSWSLVGDTEREADSLNFRIGMRLLELSRSGHNSIEDDKLTDLVKEFCKVTGIPLEQKQKHVESQIAWQYTLHSAERMRSCAGYLSMGQANQSYMTCTAEVGHFEREQKQQLVAAFCPDNFFKEKGLAIPEWRAPSLLEPVA